MRNTNGPGKWDNPTPGRRWMMRELSDALLDLLSKRFDHSLSDCRILDVGCAHGAMLGWLEEQGAQATNLVGVGLLPNQIEVGRRRHPAFVFLESNAERLPFPDSSFDMVLVFTVFSSILDDSTARNVARTITRVLKRDGVVMWYDIRYPSPNRNVRAMTKTGIRRLFPGFSICLSSLTLILPLGDALGRFADATYLALSKIPFLRSHYLGLLSPPCSPMHRG